MSRGVLGSNLNGPHVIEGYLAALYYRNFLENELPLYLKDMPLVTQGQMWLHDGLPLHFG